MTIQQGYQFGRYVEVEIKNFTTKEKTIIPNDFEIDFEFYKTVDQVNNASVGVVKIYGLKEDTIRKINSDGGEIALNCGYSNSNIETLFVADILSVIPSVQSGTSVTEIRCSANVLAYSFGQHISLGAGLTTVYNALTEISNKLGVIPKIVISTSVPDNMIKEYIELLSTWAFKIDFFGTPQQVLEMICLNFDFQIVDEVYTDEKTGVKTKVLVFGQNDNGVATFLNIIQEGYPKYSEKNKKEDAKNNTKKEKLEELFITPRQQSKTAIVLTKKSGLISAQAGYKIATITATQELSANESQTEASKQKESEFNTKQKERKAKYEKRVAAGKKVKPFQNKVTTRRVNRRFMQFEAQINPSLRPQGHVLIYPMQEEYRGIYIVRDITFKGNNKQGDWKMSGTAEDTNGWYDDTNPPNAEVLPEDTEEAVTGSVDQPNTYGGDE